MKAPHLPSEADLLGEILLGWVNINVAVANATVDRVDLARQRHNSYQRTESAQEQDRIAGLDMLGEEGL